MRLNRFQRRKAWLRKRALLGVAARARKRMERIQDSACVAEIVIRGPMFGGVHLIRLLDCNDGKHVYVVVDGETFGRPKSWQGVVRILAKRLSKGSTP